MRPARTGTKPHWNDFWSRAGFIHVTRSAAELQTPHGPSCVRTAPGIFPRDFNGKVMSLYDGPLQLYTKKQAAFLNVAGRKQAEVFNSAAILGYGLQPSGHSFGTALTNLGLTVE